MAEERIQRTLAAILAADLVGHSRMMDADKTETRVRFGLKLVDSSVLSRIEEQSLFNEALTILN